MSNTKELFRNLKTACILGFATGLYPAFFYYSNNFTLVNSTKQLLFFITLFLCLPSFVFFLLHLVVKPKLSNISWNRLLTFTSVGFFLMFIQLCLLAEIKVLYSLLVIVISAVIAWFVFVHYKKIVALQFVLAVIGLFSLVPILYRQFNYSSEWTQQPDDIEDAVFTNKPNVYFIQPDGYVNFSEINHGDYGVDNSTFKSYLEDKQFTLYDDFRSNYTATLLSNASLFAMKHHYNNYGFNLSEIINGRELVITNNPVLNTFKRNNYKTHFLAEWPFFLTSYAEMGYDECNFTVEEDVKFVGKGYYKQKDIIEPLKNYIDTDSLANKYFFLQVFSPGHIKFYEKDSKGKEQERTAWIERLYDTNKKLEEIIDIITQKDSTAIIAILADHGGYVGLDYMEQIHTKTTNRDHLYSAFSVQLAIRWPQENSNTYKEQLNTNVNLFRVLFSYLANEPAYLEHLQEDASFVTIEKGAPHGVYKCIDANGNVVFEKL